MYLNNEERKNCFNTAREPWYAFKDGREKLLERIDEFEAMARELGSGRHSNLGASAANIKIELIARANHCTIMQRAINDLLIGIRESGTAIRNLDESVAGVLNNAALQFQVKEIENTVSAQTRDVNTIDYKSGYSGGSSGIMGVGAGAKWGTSYPTFTPFDYDAINAAGGLQINGSKFGYYCSNSTDMLGKADSAKLDEFLYNIADLTGCDYALLRVKSQYENTGYLKEFPGHEGEGCFGLTYPKSQGYNYWTPEGQNLYGITSDVDAMLNEALMRTFGTTDPTQYEWENDYMKSVTSEHGNFYYDSVISSLCLVEGNLPAFDGDTHEALVQYCGGRKHDGERLAGLRENSTNELRGYMGL